MRGGATLRVSEMNVEVVFICLVGTRYMINIDTRLNADMMQRRCGPHDALQLVLIELA